MAALISGSWPEEAGPEEASELGLQPGELRELAGLELGQGLQGARG